MCLINAISLFLLIIICYTVPKYGFASHTDLTSLQLTVEERSWLKEHPNIHVGLMHAWPPHSFIGSDGTPQGIAVDYISAINQRLNGALKIVSGPWKKIYDDVKNKQLDAVLGITPNPKWEPYFNFTLPYLDIPHVLVARKKMPYISSGEELEGKTIAVEIGFVNILIFQANYPNVLLKQYEDTSSALGAVVRGEADAYAGNRAVATYLMEKEVMVNLKIHGRMNNLGSTLAVGVRKDWPILRDILQKSMDSISRKEKQSILRKWVDIEEKKSTEELHLTPEEKNWLREHPAIYVGVMNAWPPFDFVSSDGAIQGIGVDYINAINRRLNGTLKIVPGPWEEIYGDVRAKRLDAILDITPKASRESDFNFTSPYLDVPHVLVARKGIPHFQSVEALVGKTVALEKGFGNILHFREKYPNVQIKQYKDTSSALDAVVRGEADAYAGNRAVATYLMDKEVMVNLKVHGRMKKPGSILAIGTRKDWPILRDILQKSLNTITSEEKLAILRKWTGEQRPSIEKVELNADERRWLKAHPEITLGTGREWLPYVVVGKDDRIKGVEIDLLERINALTGANIQLVTGKWSDMVDKAKAREIDGLAISAHHQKREAYFLFTDSTYRIYKYICTRSPQFDNVRDLVGKRVGLTQGNRLEEKLLKKITGITLVPAESNDALISLLENGQADAIIGGINLRLSALEKMASYNSFIVPDSETEMLYSIRNDWPELKSIINKALAAIPLGERVAMLEKWGGRFKAKSVVPEFQLTEKERVWLAEHKRIRLGVDVAWPPIEWVDKAGNYQGMTSDYLYLLERMLGIEALPSKKMSWLEILEKAKQRKIDVILALDPSKEREKYLNFTSSYLHFPFVIFTRDDAPFITNLKDLYGKQVAVEEGYIAYEYLQRDHPRISLSLYKTTEEILRALSMGEIDAYVGNLTVAGYLINKTGLTNIKVAAPTPYDYDLSIGVRKDWPELIPILDRALLLIDEEQRNAIQQRWLKLHYEVGVDYALVKRMAIAVVIIILLITGWMLFIQRKDRMLGAAKAETEAANIELQKANIKLKELDRLKSMFIASISHELRTPLNSIIGFSGIMKRGAYSELDDKYQDYITRINRSGLHLLALITDIIDISKLESGRIDIIVSDFELDEMVFEAVDSIRQQVENKGMSLETGVSKGISMHTDRTRLLQCLLNFLSNAMKFSEHGTIYVMAKEQPENILLSVRDTGIGISEKDCLRLFEAFERIDSHLRVKAGGTGLGLYLTKKIATELLQGEVGLETRLGKGSTFWISVPKMLAARD
ncbi:MAG: transporter substrate-binding domain-containing protein [Candidatus Thiodiazotropha sp. (ex Lucinoma kastoroae)]|nr:transporter substrate-binding domain-containing protein [Candidatus Thiodiazotropha sp. (ex Lucinoma kastoroae)]